MPKPEVQILVCVKQRPPGARKTCCAPRGGMDVYRRFKDRIRELGVRNEVIATSTGCLKHCSRGVTVAIWPWNIWYGRVTVDDVDEILERTALGGGEEIERLRMPPGGWE